MEWVAFAVIGVVVLVFVLAFALRARGWPAARGWAGAGARRGAAAELDEYPVLLNMVLGDRAKAERLIAFEGRKAPGARRPHLIRCAIERLRDELRR